MSDILDSANPAHEKALRMLRTDLIAWFTTVDSHGSPHAVPVWFFWHGGRVVVFSEPQTVKVQHVRRGSPVLVHLQAGGPFGDDVLVLNGRAEVSERPAAEWLAEFGDAYTAKYAEAAADFGMTLDEMPQRFSTALVFTPERVLTW
jgi:PPOX class probable F420-dependent enzyme